MENVFVKSNGKAQTQASDYTKEQYYTWYYQMLQTRRFEEKAAQLYGQQKIKGFCHLYIGQEAVGAGLESAIRKDDYIITAYRDHGNALMRGVSSRAGMAELFAKSTGCTKGKGGSMHFFSKEHNFLGGHGIVGAQIGLAAGMAFAIKYRKEDKVAVCLFGDGAARQGMLHEAFNLAMFWKLPVIFICENNFYAMGTSVARSSNVTEIYKLGAAYDMPSERINGMSVFNVHEDLSRVVDYVRAGNGPYFVEAATYRYRGHSMSDPAKYRTKEELNEYKDQDPIVHLKDFLVNNAVFGLDEFDEIEAKVKAEIDDAVDFAEKSPYPDPAELYNDVYVENDYPFIREI